MLANLHVKNFAIIDEIDIDFGHHLNILTGETGAGKSILVGSISIALGARVSPDIIGKHGDYAMVEVVFQMEDEETIEKIQQLDIEPEDGQIVISRKITAGRSINKINGESVSVNVIRQVAALCIDIHGQHEHQSLLDMERHKEIVDEYGGEETRQLRELIQKKYEIYTSLKKEYETREISEEEQARQLGFLQYEIQEIERASLEPSEVEDIEEKYRRLANAGTIVEHMDEVYQYCKEDAQNAVGRASQVLQKVTGLELELSDLLEELNQIEGLLGDFNREVSRYMTDYTFDENELRQTEQRLDTIRTLQSKYGEKYEDIVRYLEEAKEKQQQLEDYEKHRESLCRDMETAKEQLREACDRLTARRKTVAKQLADQITNALTDLNFAHVEFAIEVRPTNAFAKDGQDEVEFMIATNPGEPLRSLGKIASGGELSRIMLAIKSVFADSDHIETLIFDEIDVGISGRTAQKVSEKMSVLGKEHQIICITHLSQIAAMADRHFVIEKEVTKDASVTNIRPLNEEEMIVELARILGGVQITDAVYENAKEMKQLATKQKNYK